MHHCAAVRDTMDQAAQATARAYRNRRGEVRGLLTLIGRALDQHATAEIDYARVGDLSEVATLLREILTFLAGIDAESIDRALARLRRAEPLGSPYPGLAATEGHTR